jgi:pyruvate-formate lyase
LGGDGTVSSQEELEERASDIVDGLGFACDVDMLSEYCSREEAAEHVRKLAKAFDKKAREKARYAWECAQKESESI